eukprot:s573_g16.t1
MYRRDELIQSDFEWLMEAVFDFYQRDLDNLIRSNERLWGDFCMRREDENGKTEDEEGNTLGLEMVPPPGGFLPDKEYKLSKHNIIPFPEKHFSFSTKMMLLAIQLYKERSDYQFHPFTQFAFDKLESYVESKKQLTKESYRHFVEHAYNQFFVEEMDDVPMPDDEQPDPYAEFPDEMKVDEDQPEQQEQQPHGTEADQEEVPDVPSFEVKIREPKDTGSPQDEEVSEHKEGSKEPEEPYETILIYDSEEERLGHFIMSHVSEEDQLCWRQLVLGLRNVNAREPGEDPPNLPQTVDEVTPWQMNLMMELIASEKFHAIMETWTPALGIEISYDKMHELRLTAAQVKLKTKDIHLHHFANDAKPELPRPELEARHTGGDPEFRDMEDLENKPNKFAIEGEDDTLIDLTVQWLNMFNKETMKAIMKKMIKEEDQDTITLKQKESADLGREDDEDREHGIIHLRNDDGSMISPELAALFKEFCRRQREAEKKRKEEEKDPVLPPPEHINQYLESKEKEAENKHGSSSKKEEPAAPASSSQKEASGEKGSQQSKEPAPKLFYGSDIPGCEEDSVLRTLRECFPDSQWEQWCGFYNRGYPQSEQHKHMFWHTQYRIQDLEFNEVHAESWYQPDEFLVMDEYVARHKSMDIESELEELRNCIAFDCSDPRLALRRRAQVEKLTEKAERKLQEDWDKMEQAMAEYIQQRNKLQYCSILQSMAMSFLGAGAVSDEEKDSNYPYRYVSWAIFEIKFGTTVDRASGEEEELIHARLHMVRTCVYHVSQKRISSSAGICGEAIATMVWECMRYQVDIIAGDGNKACYYPTPAKPCVPTYEVSLIQFWIDRIMGCATQERLKSYQSDAAPVRVKHFITASFTDLMFLKEKLFRITTDKYTEKLSKETDRGDCCMMSIVEWGHARVVIEENIDNFDNQFQKDEVGEFNFEVNETCLHNDANMFPLYPNDKDSHNPFLIHLTPFDFTYSEGRQFIPLKTKMKRKQTRKELQRANRRKKYEGQDDEGPWLERGSWRDYRGNPYWTQSGRQWEDWTQRDDNTDWWEQPRQHQRSGKGQWSQQPRGRGKGRGGGSSPSSSQQWRRPWG